MECFAVYADEIEGRIDPYYYKPDFVELEKKVLKKQINNWEILLKQYPVGLLRVEKWTINCILMKKKVFHF